MTNTQQSKFNWRKKQDTVILSDYSRLLNYAFPEGAKLRRKRYAEKHPGRPQMLQKKWRARNPEKMRAMRAKWVAKNPDYRLRWQRENKDKIYLNQTKYRYGLSPTARLLMEKDQNGLCAICRNPSSGKRSRLCVDHDHETSQIRELLCNGCNAAIGHFRHDLKILNSAIKYIKKHKLTYQEKYKDDNDNQAKK